MDNNSFAMNSSRLDTRRFMLICLLFGFSAISYFDRIIMTAAGPGMMHDFNLSTTVMGRIYSAFILGYALMMIPAGHLTDRIGGRTTLVLMGIGSALFTVLTASTGALAHAWIGIAAALIAVRFCLGVMTAPLYPACARVIRTWIPTVLHARVQGVVIAGSSLGAAVSPIVFTWLLARSNWRTPFLVAALATALLAVMSFGFPSDAPLVNKSALNERAALRPSTPWLRLFTDRNLMLFTAAYAALGYFQYIFFYWMYYYFGQVLHLSQSASARYIALLFLVEGAIMPLGGWISDRLTRARGLQIGRRWVPITALSLAAILTYAGVANVGLTAVACFSLAFGLAACCEGPFWAAVTEIGGANVGSASSILNTGAQVGGFFAPLLTPIIAERFGWSRGLYVGILVVCGGALAVYFVRMRTVFVDEAALPQTVRALP